MYVRSGLTTAFPSCTIRAEQTQASGRLDLEVEERDWTDASTIVRHAILELKVLKSFTSGGVPIGDADVGTRIVEGIKQAASYRIERDARHSALCCFDMRKTFTAEECFTKVMSRAKRLRVKLCVWHLFSSAKAYRDALTADSE